MEKNANPLSGSTVSPTPTDVDEKDKQAIDEAAVTEGMASSASEASKVSSVKMPINKDKPKTETEDDPEEEDDTPRQGMAKHGMRVDPPSSASSLGGVAAGAKPTADEPKQPETPPPAAPPMGAGLQASAASSPASAPPTPTQAPPAPPTPPRPMNAAPAAPAPPKPQTQPTANDNPFPNHAPASANATPPPVSGNSMAAPSTPAAPRKGPKAYLVEYLLSLVMTGTLIGVAISFFTSIINSVGATGARSGWAAQLAYTSSLVTLSTAIVFIAALVVVSHRCRKTEAAMPEIKHNKWRKGFLAVFLVLVGVSALAAATSMVYSLVSLLASMGVVSIEIDETIKSIANGTFSFLLLASTVVLYSQDYRTSTMNARMERVHHWGLIAGVIALSVLFVLMPLRDQRDSFIDGIASSDIRTLQRAVDNYARDENSLPSGLRVLDIRDDIEGRLDNYEYIEGDDGRSYELCAEFRTDTTGESASGNPLEDALGGSGLGISASQTTNPDRHEAGRQCFEYDAPIYTRGDFGSGFGGFGDLEGFGEPEDFEDGELEELFR